MGRVGPPFPLTIALGLGHAALDTIRTRLTQLPGIWYIWPAD